MKRALVLNGGGSRGAYEIGVWKALEEMNIRFNAVYGASIGALNAMMVAKGNVAEAEELWRNITISQVMSVEDPEDFAIEHMVSNKSDVIPFLVENARHLRMDIGPLEALVAEKCDEGRIRAGGMNLGMTTFRVPQMQGLPIRLRDMKTGTLKDWVIASASCFPIFKAKVIDGQRYIDGGYYDNLPIDMALADGADEIVAVELHPEATHPEYGRMPWLKSIRPRHSLGGFLDFRPELMQRSIRLGYQDAMKACGRFEGWKYTLRRVDALNIADTARRFIHRATAFDAEIMRRGILHAGHPVNAPLLTAIESETDYEKLSWNDAWLRGLELCAEVMGYRVDAIYEPMHLFAQIRDYCLAQPGDAALDEASLHDAWREGSRQVLALLTKWLYANGNFPEEVIRRLAELPRETAGALFLHTMAAKER